MTSKTITTTHKLQIKFKKRGKRSARKIRIFEICEKSAICKFQILLGPQFPRNLNTRANQTHCLCHSSLNMKRSKAPSALAFKKPRLDTPSTNGATPAEKPPPKLEVKKEEKDNDAPETNGTTEHAEAPPSIPSTKAVVSTTKPSPASTVAKPGFKTPFKSPFAGGGASKLPAKGKEEKEGDEVVAESTYYMVLWTNFSMKKHKTWNDGRTPSFIPSFLLPFSYFLLLFFLLPSSSLLPFFPSSFFLLPFFLLPSSFFLSY